MRLVLLITLVIALIAGPALAGFIVAPGGYSASESDNLSVSGYLGGFDVYGDKFVVFSGSDIKIVNASGANESTVYTYSSSVYASFVKVIGNTAYFGESKYGTIRSASLDGGSAGAILATIDYNYDFTADPQGRMFAVASTSDWSASNIIYIDANGNTKVVATVAGASGPISFDAQGNMFYGGYSEDGAATIYKWSATQVNDAVASGGTQMSNTAYVTNVQNPSFGTCDAAGSFYFTSWNVSPGTIWKVAADDQAISEFATIDPSYGWTSFAGIRYDAASGRFAAVGSLGSAYKIGVLQPVPEPSALAALGSMLGLALTFRRRSR